MSSQLQGRHRPRPVLGQAMGVIVIVIVMMDRHARCPSGVVSEPEQALQEALASGMPGNQEPSSPFVQGPLGASPR